MAIYGFLRPDGRLLQLSDDCRRPTPYPGPTIGRPRRSLGPMWRTRRTERLYPMTNHLPPRRTFSVRARLLSVTGLAVVASVLIWHNQVTDLLAFDSGADKQPVVAGGPGGSPPPQ